MRRGIRILVAILALSGCATETPAPPSQEAHRYCTDQMYARRVAHARGAPMLTIYDYCLRQHQT